MPETQQNQPEQQAMLWQARLSSDLIDAQQLREFDVWLAATQENRQAWEAINRFWVGLDNVTLDDIGGESHAKLMLLTLPARQPYFKTGLALAASLLLTLTIGYQQLAFYLADYRSATGQQRQITLADGSTILLNTASAVSVDFSEQRRLVTLHSGEAYFKIAPDRNRPFVVSSNAGQVQALGTAFDVKQQQDDASVTVFEHAVKVTTASGQVQEKLAEAEQLIFSRERIKMQSTVNLQRAAAWHQQRMVFQDKPLAEVAAELDRYRSGKIIILDDAIKNLPITGVFDIADTNIALDAIAQSLPVNVKKLSDKLVVLVAR